VLFACLALYNSSPASFRSTVPDYTSFMLSFPEPPWLHLAMCIGREPVKPSLISWLEEDLWTVQSRDLRGECVWRLAVIKKLIRWEWCHISIYMLFIKFGSIMKVFNAGWSQNSLPFIWEGRKSLTCHILIFCVFRLPCTLRKWSTELLF
jgi:hypothetical protein